jgi:hypothetical protein
MTHIKIYIRSYKIFLICFKEIKYILIVRINMHEVLMQNSDLKSDVTMINHNPDNHRQLSKYNDFAGMKNRINITGGLSFKFIIKGGEQAEYQK